MKIAIIACVISIASHFWFLSTIMIFSREEIVICGLYTKKICKIEIISEYIQHINQNHNSLPSSKKLLLVLFNSLRYLKNEAFLQVTSLCDLFEKVKFEDHLFEH
jgi:hypothetical protein